MQTRRTFQIKRMFQNEKDVSKKQFGKLEVYGTQEGTGVLRATLGKTRKSVPGGLGGVAQGAENGFFLQKNGHFSTFYRTTALCSMRIEVCCAFLRKKTVSKLFFLRDFFRFLLFFCLCWHLAVHCTALQGAQALLSRFRTCQKMSKNVKKCYFF